MEARFLALLILVPFVAVFAYASWHEYKRFKSEGRSIYGLSYDPETNSTYVGPIQEDEEGFDPDDFDPDLLETEAKERAENETADPDRNAADAEHAADTKHARDTDQPDPDDKPQDTRT